MGDFYNYGNVFMIKFMDQYYKCSLENFLMTLDNRMSNVSFFTGTLFKLTVDTIVYFLFEFGGSGLIPEASTFITGIGWTTDLKGAIEEFNNANGEAFNLGKATGLIVKTIVDFEAPRIMNSPSTF